MENRLKVSKKNIMEFDGLEEANEEIVEAYINTINRSDKSAIYAGVCMLLFVIGVLGFCATPTVVKAGNTIASIVVIAISSISLLLAIIFLIADILDREKALYAQRGKAYIADCFVFDKEENKRKDKDGNEIIYYDVKVEDKKGHYIDTWYAVDKGSFDTNEHPLKLIVFDYESKYVYDVRSDKMLGIKKKKK